MTFFERDEKNLCESPKNSFVAFFSGPSPRLQRKFIVFVPEAQIVKSATVLHHVLVVDVLRHVAVTHCI